MPLTDCLVQAQQQEQMAQQMLQQPMQQQQQQQQVSLELVCRNLIHRGVSDLLLCCQLSTMQADLAAGLLEQEQQRQYEQQRQLVQQVTTCKSPPQLDRQERL